MKTDRDVLEVVKGAVDAGGAGITMGRNVWKRDNVVGMVRALRIIIHEDATVEDAMEELNV
jgi:class I fructose-bisphosphate aldolase